MNIISPSILSADFGHLADEIKKIDEAGSPYIHLDVMDGSFVPNISFGPAVIKSIRPLTDRVFDVHLMVDDPIRFLDDYKDAGADIITVHAEACKHLQRTVTRIREMGMKAGVALNPSTPVSVLDFILEDIDMVVVMSVNPGFSGQRFIPSALNKTSIIREMINDRVLNTDIEVDGGVTLLNAPEVIRAGANILVAGSGVFSGDSSANVKAFNEILISYE